MVMPAIRPTILVLSVEKEPWHSQVTGHLHTVIRSKANLIEAETTEAAYAALATDLTAVFIGDGVITKRKHRELANALVAYTKDGGTVLLGCLMSSFSAPSEFNRMMEAVWSLPWRFGSYSREDSTLNETASTDRITGAPVPKTINVKAVYLQKVAPQEKIYARGERITPRTMTQKLLEQYEETDATGEAAVAFGSVGEGHLGWIGDVNSEEQLDSVYLALLGLPHV
jgi:hypothetical protein